LTNGKVKLAKRGVGSI